MNTCGILVDRQESTFHDSSFDETGCLLHSTHIGPHLFRGKDGEFYKWGDDQECDCCDTYDDYDPANRCYWYKKISESEALTLLPQQPS